MANSMIVVAKSFYPVLPNGNTSISKIPPGLGGPCRR